MRKKSKGSNVILIRQLADQNLYRFRVKAGMTRKSKSTSSSFFPHNFRKKTAKVFKTWQQCLRLAFNQGLKIAFLFFVFCFLFLNLHSSLFPENERLSQAKKEVLNSPLDAKTHLGLARVYLDMRSLEAAEKELSLAKGLTSIESSDLKSAKEALEKAKEKPEKIRQEISFWEKVVKEKPDYRDAYFQLAVLNYQLSQKGATVKYLRKTLELDPNFEPAKKLEKLLD